MWFDSWFDIVRVIVVGEAAYVSLVLFIRISGKRTLAQFNAFDYVVTVALGSTLATILLTSDVSYLEGAVAFAVLLGLQVAVAFAITRWRAARQIATSAATLLLWEGQVDEDALRRNRISRDVIDQAVRQAGEGDLSAIGAVVLESNGQLSVISRDRVGSASCLRALRTGTEDAV